MRFLKMAIILVGITSFSACGSQMPDNSSGENENTAAANESSELIIVDRPQTIAEKMKARGDQDQAKPELLVESPHDGETIISSTVTIKVRIGGDLKGLKMGKDKEGTGNHVHVILDNQPYAAHYMWDEGFELRNVADGKHTLRMFASRPWHESFKNEKAFKNIKFTVKNGRSDETRPTTDDNGNTLADAKKPLDKLDLEGADVNESKAGDVDFAKPLLTFSRPKGTYKGESAGAIMIDFWLTNAVLSGDGGKYKVRYSINGSPPKMIEKWAPIWLKGWKNGKNTIKLDLVDNDGKLVENGGYNSTTREITVTN